jgi:hypothetical protein
VRPGKQWAWRREVRMVIYSSDFALRRIGRMSARVGWAPRQGPGRGHVWWRKGKEMMMVSGLQSTRELFQICSDDPGKPANNKNYIIILLLTIPLPRHLSYKSTSHVAPTAPDTPTRHHDRAHRPSSRHIPTRPVQPTPSLGRSLAAVEHGVGKRTSIKDTRSDGTPR